MKGVAHCAMLGVAQNQVLLVGSFSTSVQGKTYPQAQRWDTQIESTCQLRSAGRKPSAPMSI